MPQLQIFLSQDNRISFDLGEEKVTIGRLAHNVLQIDDLSVSSHHADLFLEAGRYHLHDPGSTNGTYVNGEQITDAILRNGDELRFGSVEAIFLSDAEASLSQPRPDFLEASLDVATSSARPANFVSLSPAPKNIESRDPMAAALYGLAALALVSFAATLYFVLTM
ncbi:MAG TPA: FHA domain-containing protein [Terrimicrobiaceae bacterium]|jgi:pSer/pThr/pTyr-binding forkhead associated (FHA) protein